MEMKQLLLITFIGVTCASSAHSLTKAKGTGALNLSQLR